MATYSREEQTNWYRVCRLLTEGGKMILIDFLKQSIGSYTLDSYLASKRNDVNKVKQLHQPQKDILYPPGGGNTDTRQWDITLTSCIINKLIKPTDPLQKSSVDDIRQIRNGIFGHCGELRMNKSEYQTNWSRIKQVLSTASVVLLHNAGSFSLTSLEEDVEKDEVTSFALNQMKHILDNWMQCDIVGGLSEVKNVVEKQTDGLSEVKSAVIKQTDGLSEVKSVVEKQTDGLSEVKSVVEKQTDGLSEVKSVVEKQTDGLSEVKSAVEKQTGGLSEVKSAVIKQTDGLSEMKSAVEKQIDGLSEVKSVVEKQTDGLSEVKSAVEKQTDGLSEVKSAVIKQTDGLSEVKSAVEKQTDGLSEVKSAVEKQTGGLSEVKSAVIKQTDGLSEMKSAVEKQIDGLSEVKSVVEKQTDGLSEVKSAVEKQTDGLSEVKSAVIKQTDGLSEVKSAVEKQTDGLSEVKSAVEKQTDGLSEVKSAVEKQTDGLSEVKSAVEKQTDGLSEVKSAVEGLTSAVEGLKNTIARVDRACSEIKDSSCHILEGQVPAPMQSQSPNDQGAAAENIPLKSTTTDEGFQTRTGLPPECEGLQSHLIAYYKKYVIKSPTVVNTARGQTDIDDIYVEPDLVVVDHTALTKETAKEEGISIEHIFHDDTNKCRLIYLNGDAGMGKTSFTKYLVSEWCKSHLHDKNIRDVNTLSSMKQFDFLFHVSLRNAKGTYKISDMIVAQLLEGYSCIGPCYRKKTNPHLFLDELLEHWSDRCLIIFDGLDEWKAPEKSSCPAVSDGIPGRNPHLKYTILTTSRPWKMEQLRLAESEIDRQLKLKGVKSVSGFGGKMISYYNERLQKDKQYAVFERVLAEEGLRKMRATPILLKQLICLWFHEQSFGKSKTEIYTNMVDLLLQLAEQREKVKQLNTDDRRSSETVPTPSCFKKGGRCVKYKSLLLSLGKLAFETQFCGEEESRLVFKTDETEAYGMSEEEIDVCLSIGVLTQDIVPEPVRDLKSMSFMHKTFHEYFTALYLSAYGENLNDIDTRFSYKSLNLDSLLDMEDTVIFLGGMCPLFLKDTMSKYLVEIVNKDETVVRCRYDYTDSRDIRRYEIVFDLNEGLSNLKRVQSMMLACCKECSRNGRSPLCLPLPDYFSGDLVSHKKLNPEELSILDICLQHYPLQLKSFNLVQHLDDYQGIKQNLDISPYINLCRLMIQFRNQTCIISTFSMPTLEYIDFLNVSSLRLPSLIQSARKLKVLILNSTQYTDPSTGITSSRDLDLSGHIELIYLFLENLSLETLAVNSSLITLCIINVLSITRVHLGSVKCREHDEAMACGYSIELSECRKLEKLHLEDISAESVTLSPSIRKLTLNNIHTFKHDALCSLLASISNTRSFTKVHLESVRCREHGKGVDCGYSIELSECRKLEKLYLEDISAESVTLSPLTRKLTLNNIHTFKHDALCSLMASISNTGSLKIVHLESVRCREHGKGVDCGYSIELSECRELEELDLKDISAESVTLSPSIRKLTLNNIHKFKHDPLCSLMSSISNTRSFTKVHLESVRCREHGKVVDCGYSIELSECRKLEKLYLEDISAESVTLSPSIKYLTLITIHTFKHDALCSLMASISNTGSLTIVHLESVRCREHGKGVDCGYSIELSECRKLEMLCLIDISAESVTLSPSITYLLLRNIHTFKHDALCSLMASISNTGSLKIVHLESVRCREHGKGVDCGYSIELSECRELEELDLKDISAESVTLSPSIRKLTVNNIHKFKHDPLCSLMSSISNTRSFTKVHLESVRCREHGKGVDCGYSIELSECRKLEKLYLEDISAESVTLGPSIKYLTLRNIHTFKHGALCSLMASISNTRSLTLVRLESVQCREHGRGVTCGYTIDLSGHDRLTDLDLIDLSPASVRICEVEGKIELSDIHTLQHKELSELLTLARQVEIHAISKSTCAEHGMSIDCMLNLGLEDIIDEVFSDADDKVLDDELFSDPDDVDLNLQLHLHHLYSGAVSINKTDAENQNVVESGDLNSHAENLISNTDTATDADDNGDSNLEQEGTDELLEDTGDVNLQH